MSPKERAKATEMVVALAKSAARQGSPRDELLALIRDRLAGEAMLHHVESPVPQKLFEQALRALEVLAAGDDCCGYEGASPRRCREALQILRGER